MLRVKVILLSVFFALAAGKAIEYEKTEEDKLAPVYYAVSSTVIPLDDLPVYKVGYGFGFKPSHVKEDESAGEKQEKVGLITKKQKYRLHSAIVEEISKTDFEG